MPTARYFSLVTVLPTNEMIIIGGCIHKQLTNTNVVEIAIDKLTNNHNAVAL